MDCKDSVLNGDIMEKSLIISDCARCSATVCGLDGGGGGAVIGSGSLFSWVCRCLVSPALRKAKVLSFLVTGALTGRMIGILDWLSVAGSEQARLMLLRLFTWTNICGNTREKHFQRNVSVVFVSLVSISIVHFSSSKLNKKYAQNATLTKCSTLLYGDVY